MGYDVRRLGVMEASGALAPSSPSSPHTTCTPLASGGPVARRSLPRSPITCGVQIADSLGPPFGLEVA